MKYADVERFRSLLSYCQDTGNLSWKSRDLSSFKNPRLGKTWNTKYSGKVAGSKRTMGTLIQIDGVAYLAHRVAWAMHYGEPPAEDLHIDHINGNPNDNRITNLRTATPSQNQYNRKTQRNNVNGLKGVYRTSSRTYTRPWIARINVAGKTIWVGCYHTKAEAAVAYAKASLRHHGKYSYYARG